MAVLASAIWRVRGSTSSGGAGSNTNGGGYDPGIAGAATDYSQQSAAQATGTATSAAAVLTSTTAVFTAAMIGNAIWLNTGTPQWRFIVGFTSSLIVTLDAAPTATAVTFNVGGAWADPFSTNITSTGPMVPGNILYISGGGTDNPGSADYTTTSFRTPTPGNSSAGYVRFIGENGRPRLHSDGLMYYRPVAVSFENLYVGCTSNSNGAIGLIGYDDTSNANADNMAINCVFDQCGKNVVGFQGGGLLLGCEFFSSTANAGAAGTQPAVLSGAYGLGVHYCNIHDTWGDGVALQGIMDTLLQSVVSKCTGNGVVLTNVRSAAGFRGRIVGNTIDGNLGHAITVATASTLQLFDCYGNFITNHVTAAINVGAGSATVNDRIKSFWDFNWFYNNTANYNNISAGPHDAAGTDPLYTSQSTQDYTLQSTSPAIAKGFPSAAVYAVPGATPAPMSTISPLIPRRNTSPAVESYMDEGAVQRVMAAGGGSSGMIVHPGMSGGMHG